MSKKLNIIEAMKMPIGTEFEVIFKGEKILTNTMKIYSILVDEKECKYIDWSYRPEDTFIKPYDFLINAIFILVQQPVSFMEAVESNKRCKVEHELINDTSLYPYDKKRLTEFNALDWVLFIITNNEIDINEIILNGKWYIEESEE